MALKMKEWGNIFNLLQKEHQKGYPKREGEYPKMGEGGSLRKGGGVPALQETMD